MKKFFVTALCATLLVLSSTTAHAAAFTFNVLVDTSSLANSSFDPLRPLALDFQLIGGASPSNTAKITNVNFGGAVQPAAPLTIDDFATGDLASELTLQVSPVVPFFSAFLQEFNPGAFLSFDVELTTNIANPSPDAFSFQIRDKNFAALPTTNFADALLLVNLDSANPLLQTFDGEGAFSGVTITAVPTPEPASLLLLGAGLIGASAARRRNRASR